MENWRVSAWTGCHSLRWRQNKHRGKLSPSLKDRPGWLPLFTRGKPLDISVTAVQCHCITPSPARLSAALKDPLNLSSGLAPSVLKRREKCLYSHLIWGAKRWDWKLLGKNSLCFSLLLVRGIRDRTSIQNPEGNFCGDGCLLCPQSWIKSWTWCMWSAGRAVPQ